MTRLSALFAVGPSTLKNISPMMHFKKRLKLCEVYETREIVLLHTIAGVCITVGASNLEIYACEFGVAYLGSLSLFYYFLKLYEKYASQIAKINPIHSWPTSCITLAGLSVK